MTRKESQTQSMHKLEHIICACNEAKLRATIDAQEVEISTIKNECKILRACTVIACLGMIIIALIK